MAVEHPTSLRRGTRIDDFRVLGLRGDGAYGTVYEVRKAGERFALKLARHRHHSNDAARTDERMQRELSNLLLLEHPHIIRVYGWSRYPHPALDYGYLVLEYVDGWTLSQWLQEQRPSFAQVVKVFARLAGALAYMHSRGVLHRDISHSNVLIRKADGEPVIVDLGAGAHPAAAELTDAPLPPGTNRFRSPQAVRFYEEHRHEAGARYDFPPADDQFALAVCLYDALTDPRPHQRGRDVPRLLVNSPRLVPPAPREVNARVPQALSALVARLMERDPDKRLTDPGALEEALESLREEEGEEWRQAVFPPFTDTPAQPAPTPRMRGRRAVRALLALLGASALLLAGLLLPREDPDPGAPPAPTAPAPSARPPTRAPEAPPAAREPPTAEVPSPPAVLPPKESPAVSPPAAPPQRQAPTHHAPRGLSTAFLLKCAALPTALALQLGCPAAQVRPERERCPEEAVKAMREMEVEAGAGPYVTLDVTKPGEPPETAVYEEGKVTGRLEPTGWNDQGRFPNPTLLSGRIWTGGDDVIIRYTRATLPDGTEMPICLGVRHQSGDDSEFIPPKRLEGSRPGAVVLKRMQPSRWIFKEWP